MARSLKAALAYFLLVFAVGCVLGIVRTMLLAPWTGETAAVLMELPVILTAAWVICHRVVQFARVPATLIPRLSMGIGAFGLLMVAEYLLSTQAFGNSTEQHFDSYGTTHGRIGLAGQVVYGAFPLMQVTATRTVQNAIGWMARLWSILSLGFVGLFVVGHISEPSGVTPTEGEWLGLMLFPLGVGAGLVVGWWREVTGGLISVGCLVGFYIWHLTVSGGLPSGPYFALISAPGVLFLIHGWTARRD